MRADTASITTPAKPERNFAVTTAIVPVTTAIAQSKKMKIRLGIEKNVEKKQKIETKKYSKKRRKKNKKKLGCFLRFGFFKHWLKIGHFGGLCASLGGRAGNLQEPPQGKLWGCQKLQNGIFGKPQQIW